MAFTRGVGPFYNQQMPGTSVTVSCAGLTAGRMLAINMEWQDVGAAATISQVQVQGESDGTVIAGSKANDVANHSQICYHANLTAGGTKNVTVTLTNSAYMTVGVMEYAGQDPASQPDASNSITNLNNPPSLTLTTVAANALIVALCSAQNNAPTAGSAYTLWGTRPNNGYNDEDEDDLDAGAAGAKTVDFVSDNSNVQRVSAASFKPAGGAGTTPKTFTATDSLAGGELL